VKVIVNQQLHNMYIYKSWLLRLCLKLHAVEFREMEYWTSKYAALLYDAKRCTYVSWHTNCLVKYTLKLCY